MNTDDRRAGRSKLVYDKEKRAIVTVTSKPNIVPLDKLAPEGIEAKLDELERRQAERREDNPQLARASEIIGLNPRTPPLYFVSRGLEWLLGRTPVAIYRNWSPGSIDDAYRVLACSHHAHGVGYSLETALASAIEQAHALVSPEGRADEETPRTYPTTIRAPLTVTVIDRAGRGLDDRVVIELPEGEGNIDATRTGLADSLRRPNAKAWLIIEEDIPESDDA